MKIEAHCMITPPPITARLLGSVHLQNYQSNVCTSSGKWEVMRLRSCRDQNHVSRCRTLFTELHSAYVDFQSRPSPYQFDVMEFQVFQDTLSFHLHHLALVVHEIMHGQIFFQGIVDAVEPALL